MCIHILPQNAKLPKDRNEPSEPDDDDPNCTSKISVRRCGKCTNSNQCAKGHCCPFMRLCVEDSNTIQNSTFCKYTETADCIPDCHDDVNQNSCTCKNKAFPEEWAKPTCGGKLEILIIS